VTDDVHTRRARIEENVDRQHLVSDPSDGGTTLGSPVRQ
jgi:hypothetical protein